MRFSLTFALQQNMELRISYNIFRFDFFTKARLKGTFHDNIRMIRILSILAGEAKRTVEAIGGNDIFAPFPSRNVG